MSSVLGMTDPMTASGGNVTQLLQQVWRNKAYLETVKPDPILQNRDLITPLEVGDRQVVGNVNNFIMNVTPKNTGARNIVLAFLAALDMDPIEGNVQFLGNEDTLEMKWVKVYANDWAGGVSLQNFGIDARELKNYNLNQEAQRLLYQWRTEILGYYARAALVTTLSPNLTASPLSLTASYNKNWYIPSLADSAQPAYNTTAATHAHNIGAGIVTAGTSAAATIPRYLDMLNWLQDQYIEPVVMNGKPMWLQLLTPLQMKRLKDPSVTASWGAYWQNVAATDDIKRVIPTGQFIVDDKLILCEDRRSPTMVVTGGGSLNTLSFGYDKAGRSSTRNATIYTSGNTYYCDLSPILGRGALMYYEPDKTHKEIQKDEYDQFQGDALFQAIGYYTPVWNVDDAAASASTAQQESSVIMATIRA